MSCYRYDDVWFIRNRHDHGCPGQCSGCEVCAGHCTCRPGCSEHTDDAHPLTAPTCVGKARRDVSEIVALTTYVTVEAMTRGVGSPAANYAGPATDAESWSWHQVTKARGGVDWDALEDDDPVHPLRVLGTWDFMLREDYNQPTNAPATVASCAAYLDRVLARFAQDADQDFPLFAREIRTCRTRLESVIRDSNRSAQTRVPCIDCGRRLLRKYAGKAADDYHQCPGCRRRYGHREFVQAKAQHLASEGAARHVLLADAKAAIDRPDRTWRKWLRYWHVRSYRDPLTGLVWVWWPDVREADLATQRRELRAASA